MVVEQEVGNLARYSFVANHFHLVGLGPVRPTITNIPHHSLYLSSPVATERISLGRPRQHTQFYKLFKEHHFDLVYYIRSTTLHLSYRC